MKDKFMVQILNTKNLLITVIVIPSGNFKLPEGLFLLLFNFYPLVNVIWL